MDRVFLRLAMAVRWRFRRSSSIVEGVKPRTLSIRLATRDDAAAIAALSRDEIERGFPWSWTEGRVARAIANPDANVIVTGAPGALAGFGIMSYVGDDAHLL